MFQFKLGFVFAVLLTAACGSTAGDDPGAGGTSGNAGNAGLGGAAGAAGASGSGGSGGGGTAGAAGAADCSARCGAPGCPACQGPQMIPAAMPAVENYPEHPYRIDSTEVTNAHYAAFLAAGVDPAGQPAECAWNTSFVPREDPKYSCGSKYDPDTRADYPVVCIDWCDARAYCEWAGKRLCMSRGGKPTNNAAGEWVHACSASVTLAFPYGSEYDPLACNGIEYGASKLLPVASLASCEGGLPGLYDMSGNAWEWTGAIYEEAADPIDTQCIVSGGSYAASENSLKCFGGSIAGYARSSAAHEIGIRCCAESLE